MVWFILLANFVVYVCKRTFGVDIEAVLKEPKGALTQTAMAVSYIGLLVELTHVINMVIT